MTADLDPRGLPLIYRITDYLETGPSTDGRIREAQREARILLRDSRAALEETERLLKHANELLNTPINDDFWAGAQREQAHQISRWGYAHDRSKSAENWFWLVGYLAGKALRAAITGDRQKAKHHCISSAAALANWHRAIAQDESGAGIGQDNDLRATNLVDAQVMDDAAAVERR